MGILDAIPLAPILPVHKKSGEVDAVKFLKDQGFPDPKMAADIVWAESKGDNGAVNVNFDGSKDWGIFQINDKAHPDFDTKRAKDPYYNAKTALAISSGGTNWSPWVTYKTGAYKIHHGAFKIKTEGWANGGAPVAAAEKAADVAGSLPGVISGIWGTIGQIFTAGFWLRTGKVILGVLALVAGVALIGKEFAIKASPVADIAKGLTG